MTKGKQSRWHEDGPVVCGPQSNTFTLPECIRRACVRAARSQANFMYLFDIRLMIHDFLIFGCSIGMRNRIKDGVKETNGKKERKHIIIIAS